MSHNLPVRNSDATRDRFSWLIGLSSLPCKYQERCVLTRLYQLRIDLDKFEGVAIPSYAQLASSPKTELSISAKSGGMPCRRLMTS